MGKGEQNRALLLGAAYYEEYLPYDRLETDMEMMAEAGMNVIRIAESTWSVEEPRPGEYDFSHVDRVIEAAQRHGIYVIVGTPTYAVPRWLEQLDKNVMAVTADGRRKFGARQNMDITNPTYLYYAEGIIRALVAHTAQCPNVIGYQLDNETKHYNTSGENVLVQFRKWLKEQYGTIEALNQAMGLNYWSNSVTRFEDLPDPTGTINGSYACAFAHFQRKLASDFLKWQSSIVKEYLRPDQFITHNLDFEWRFFGAKGQQDGYSWGVHSGIDHFEARDAVTLVGTDIYCFDQERLTGREIAFGGDEMRSLKGQNYLVLESQAQAFKDWLPFPGQLRQMAYSHLASGACGVMYWNWYSIHNGLESYWKGILSHDFAPNPTYEEVKKLGQEWRQLTPELTGLKKKNRIALVVNSDMTTVMDWFPTDKELNYNDVVYWVYTALYELNLECDVIFTGEKDWSKYDLLIFPETYCANEELIGRVRSFVEQGGTIFSTFRSFVADESVKIYHDSLPHGLTDVFGMSYNQYTRPVNVKVDGMEASWWMELLKTNGAEKKAGYCHKYWGDYAALTRNRFGRGYAWYLGAMVDPALLKKYLLAAAKDAGIAQPKYRFPLIQRDMENQDGKKLHFLFHYSSEDTSAICQWNCTDLLTGKQYTTGDRVELSDWDVCILKE
jgi:beta-galactosidase